jgi:nucleolar MIF4G domain-containing protein 1
MNEALTDLLFESLVAHVLTPERLVMEHAMLVAILHANVGTEVGECLTLATVLSQIICFYILCL